MGGRYYISEVLNNKIDLFLPPYITFTMHVILRYMYTLQGIGDDTLRYTSIRMNDYLCKFSIKELFRPKLFTK